MYRFGIVLCALWVSQQGLLAFAQCPSTTPAPLVPATPAPTLPLVSPISVDITVLVVGIIILLILFAASFYFVVVWPRRALMEYRRRFEVLIQEEQVHADLKQLRLEENSPLYGGATKAAHSKRIPTMREIEMATLQKVAEGGGNGSPSGTVASPTAGAAPLSPVL